MTSNFCANCGVTIYRGYVCGSCSLRASRENWVRIDEQKIKNRELNEKVKKAFGKEK